MVLGQSGNLRVELHVVFGIYDINRGAHALSVVEREMPWLPKTLSKNLSISLRVENRSCSGFHVVRLVILCSSLNTVGFGNSSLIFGSTGICAIHMPKPISSLRAITIFCFFIYNKALTHRERTVYPCLPLVLIEKRGTLKSHLPTWKLIWEDGMLEILGEVGIKCHFGIIQSLFCQDE